MRRLKTLLAGLVVLATLAAAADAAESYAILANAQRLQGDVPVGYPIRLEFPLPAGSEPRITLTLSGGTPVKPMTFGQAKLYGPDGVEITLPQGTYFNSTILNGNQTLTFRHWTATQSGNHQLVIATTSARVTAHLTGRLVVVRPTKVTYKGDETTTTPIQVALQPGDVTSVAVTRVSGTAPKVVSYRLPTGDSSTPFQKMTKKGSTTYELGAPDFGDYEYTIGYQTATAAGRWKATLRIKPFKGGYPASLRVRNSPGIPISVLGADRFVVPTFGGSGIGVGTDGHGTVLITSEQGGVLQGQVFTDELVVHPNLPNVVALTSAADLSPGETLAGHRLMFMAGSYYVAFSTASGAELSIMRLPPDLHVRLGIAQVVAASPDPTTDFFLTGDGARVAVGIFHPTNGHTVTVMDATDFGVRTTYQIGGASYPQTNGAGAAWRSVDSVFELWTPDTLDFHGPSDLHRVLYNAAWSPTTSDAKPIADIPDVETMPTAVVVDTGLTNATIVHYVVADNPPSTGSAAGSGRIHRRIFDATGVEIPGSHVILQRASCNRPAATLVNNFLYLGFETPSGPMVERYSILR